MHKQLFLTLRMLAGHIVHLPKITVITVILIIKILRIKRTKIDILIPKFVFLRYSEIQSWLVSEVGRIVIVGPLVYN